MVDLAIILAYIDDIICATAGLHEHLEELEKVFRMHREAGIKVKPEKTQLIKEDVEYLGYVVSEEGVKMQDEYVRKIVEWPRPSTTKELNSFLGFIGYYRTFIPRFSELTNELNSMRKESKIAWTEEIERKFTDLKEEFSRKPIRAYPDYNSGEPFQVAVDFSHEETMKKLTGMYFRWLSEIQSYDFIVMHRSGKQNSNADGMSRSSHMDPCLLYTSDAADE